MFLSKAVQRCIAFFCIEIKNVSKNKLFRYIDMEAMKLLVKFI